MMLRRPRVDFRVMFGYPVSLRDRIWSACCRIESVVWNIVRRSAVGVGHRSTFVHSSDG